VKRAEEDEFRDYVVANIDRLRRGAYALCQEWHTADDLVAVAFGRLYRYWPRASEASNLDGYVWKVLVRSWLDERRRRWRRVEYLEEAPDLPLEDATDPAERMSLLGTLAALSPRRRAAVFLRFYFDLSVQETAEVLGCSTGTVKSLTARGLEAMRSRVVSLSTSDKLSTPDKLPTSARLSTSDRLPTSDRLSTSDKASPNKASPNKASTSNKASASDKLSTSDKGDLR
jgi:RNA polymerase sigma-70 factor (sigma-E family)